MSKFSKIQLKQGSELEAKTLFQEYVGNFPSLQFIGWAMVRAIIKDGAFPELTAMLDSAIEAGSFEQWYGSYTITPRQDNTPMLKLIPWVGDRTITVWADWNAEMGKYEWYVVVDYTARPTASHEYSPIGEWELNYPLADVVRGIGEVFGVIADWQRVQAHEDFSKIMDFVNAGFHCYSTPDNQEIVCYLGDRYESPSGVGYFSARFMTGTRAEEEDVLDYPQRLEEEEDDDEKYFGASTLSRLREKANFLFADDDMA